MGVEYRIICDILENVNLESFVADVMKNAGNKDNPRLNDYKIVREKYGFYFFYNLGDKTKSAVVFKRIVDEILNYCSSLSIEELE